MKKKKKGTGAVPVQTSDRPGVVRSLLLLSLQVIVLSSYVKSFYDLHVVEAFQTTTTTTKPTTKSCPHRKKPFVGRHTPLLLPPPSRRSYHKSSSSYISTTLYSSSVQPSSASSSKSEQGRRRPSLSSSLYNTRNAVASALQDTSITLSQRCHGLCTTLAEVLSSTSSSTTEKTRRTNNSSTEDLSRTRRTTKALFFFQRFVGTVKSYWEEYWWMSPMVLLLVPLYTCIFLQTHAAMPSWWQVTNMDHIHHHSTTTAAAAASDASSSLLSSTFVLLGTFLGSNIAYFISSIYLAIRFGMIRVKKKKQGITEVEDDGFHYFDTKEQKQEQQGQKKNQQQQKTTNLHAVAVHVQWPPVVPNFAFLALWIGTAGVVSTVFHSVQAFNGCRGFAETLCYVDHAVAITAGLYFWKTCGRPTTTVALIGAVSLVTLVVTEPGYALLHSSWHLLSAITATRWALDGYARRIQRHKEQLRGKTMESST